MDSIQQYQTAKERIEELQSWPELNDVDQAELDRLIEEVNHFKEILLNFE